MGKAKTTPVRATVRPDPRASEASAPTTTPGPRAEDQVTSEQRAALAVPRKKVDLVSVTVPAAFNLHDDDGVLHKYDSGVQDMPRSHATHWYSKAFGVELNED